MRFAFADCVLDTDSHSFHRAGSSRHLEPQVFDLLRLLAENPGNLITRDRLIEAVWGGRIVSDATIDARIAAARSAVGDSGRAQAVIRTIPRRGIELVVPVQCHADPSGMERSPPATRQTIRYATSADGSSIALAVSGDGPPLLIAAHQSTHLELDWSSVLFRPTFDELGERHRLIRFDIRGAGLSDRNFECPDIDRHVEDLAAVADAAGLDRFAILASASGTATAVRFAATRPERVSRLVVLDGYVRGRAVRGETGSPLVGDPFISLSRDEVWGNVESGYMRAWVSMIAPSLSHAEASDLILVMSQASNAQDFLANRRIIDACDSRAFLKDVNAPTLVIHSRNNSLNPLTEGRIIASGVPNAEMLVVESANAICLPGDTAWRQQIDAILSFLARDVR